MSREVYITGVSKFLPNEPISNEEMEQYLGFINNTPSRSKAIILRNNGIKTRYYALDKSGNTTHTNAELTASAIRQLFNNEDEQTEIDILACGTSSPDQLLPSHAAMVHGLLPKMNNAEIISPSGACCTSMQALKYAYMAIAGGLSEKAICTGSERIAKTMMASQFYEEICRHIELEENPYIAFEKDFLRWMLSDGAAAAKLETAPHPGSPALKIEWIDSCSFANEFETCMYRGAEKYTDGQVKGFPDYSPVDHKNMSIFSFKQDTKLLNGNIVRKGIEKMKAVLLKHKVDVAAVDYFLPHMSSLFFKNKIMENMVEFDIVIPEEKWRYNLPKVGNVGAASIFLMLEEVLHSGELQMGQKLLLLIPESARFSYSYCLLTVV